MTPAQLRRRALALGAELEIGGQRMNVSRQQAPVTAGPQSAGDMMNLLMLNAKTAAAQAEALNRMLQLLAAEEAEEEPEKPEAEEAGTPLLEAAHEAQETPQQEASEEATGMDPGERAEVEPEEAKPAEPPKPEEPPAVPLMARARARPRIVMPIRFSVTRDDDGRITALQPTYGEVSSTTLADLTATRSGGLIDTITPTYQ